MMVVPAVQTFPGLRPWQKSFASFLGLRPRLKCFASFLGPRPRLKCFAPFLGPRPRLKCFAPLVLRLAALKARHMIAWGVSPRLTMLWGVRSEGPRDSVGRAELINTTSPTADKSALSHLQCYSILFAFFLGLRPRLESFAPLVLRNGLGRFVDIHETRRRVTFLRCSMSTGRISFLGLRPRLESFSPLVLRSAAPKARHIIAWGASARLTMLRDVRSEGPRERVGRAELKNAIPPTPGTNFPLTGHSLL